MWNSLPQLFHHLGDQSDEVTASGTIGVMMVWEGIGQASLHASYTGTSKLRELHFYQSSMEPKILTQQARPVRGQIATQIVRMCISLHPNYIHSPNERTISLEFTALEPVLLNKISKLKDEKRTDFPEERFQILS